MKILFYDAKPYDRESFAECLQGVTDMTVDFVDVDLDPFTASLACGYDAVCIFVASVANEETVAALARCGIKGILLRCAGFNNVDLNAAKKYGISVARVPGYSPEAVAEHAMALTLAVNRRLHKSYIKVRENNFSLVGLTGMNLYGKTAGIVGTGKIGKAMCRICQGFGMKVIAYDRYPDPSLENVTYLTFDEVLAQADLLSLHCPLTEETYHLINENTIAKMKDGVLLVNTSRGALIKTDDLIAGIRARKFFGVGLDVYEEEDANVFENREDDILETSITARLLSFPNVIVTSHQGFLTKEALQSIGETTLQNARDIRDGKTDGINFLN